MAPACVDNLTAELESLITGTGWGVQSVTLWMLVFTNWRMLQQGVRELDILVQACQSLKVRVATDEDSMNTANAAVPKTLEKLLERWSLVKWLGGTVDRKRARVAGLVDAELGRVRSVITAALSDSEGTVTDATYCTDCKLSV